MKGKKGGVDEAAEDEKTKPEAYDKGKPEHEAEERKRGGRAERKHGGKADHECKGEGCSHPSHRHKRRMGGKATEKKKEVGHVEGEEGHHHAGRKPRKSGGRAACEASPFTSAAHGHNPRGHKTPGSID